ncbi:hypothetical protein LX77_01859 [Gelidibacter algens]|uniref:Uncharacterized protein n=1 Tax=Gelidibacter algens TaxID=49280 RepID=A0A1A7R465_9FLAO|nr:hypothetical protein [Gelidibacter algens]OBX26259.1 hypothetical protein A9996_05640 [Gelidibacter algens]RAJ24860.1 hypothetical protein LX77_01859 [Gelidibacter algens]
MILEAFKEKSNQKFINKLLNSKNVAISNRKLESVGVIIDASEFSDAEAFKHFFNELGVQLPKIKIIVFVEDEKKTEKLWGNFFSKKDFGWRGAIKHAELKMFLDTEFDALVSFHKNDALELKMAAAVSKANFKIGLSNVDDRLYDFILDVTTKDFDVFKTELKKYLTILNKI